MLNLGFMIKSLNQHQVCSSHLGGNKPEKPQTEHAFLDTAPIDTLKLLLLPMGRLLYGYKVLPLNKWHMAGTLT